MVPNHDERVHKRQHTPPIKAPAHLV